MERLEQLKNRDWLIARKTRLCHELPKPCRNLWLDVEDGTRLDFSNFTELTYLVLQSTEFPRLCSAIEYLDLYHCKIPRVPSFVANYQQLYYLVLRETELEVLPPEMGLLNLLSLDLGMNPISRLPKEFRKLALVELFLDWTKISSLENVNPIRLKRLDLQYVPLSRVFVRADLLHLDISQPVASKHFSINQTGHLWYKNKLPFEVINTDQQCRKGGKDRECFSLK